MASSSSNEDANLASVNFLAAAEQGNPGLQEVHRETVPEAQRSGEESAADLSARLERARRKEEIFGKRILHEHRSTPPQLLKNIQMIAVAIAALAMQERYGMTKAVKKEYRDNWLYEFRLAAIDIVDQTGSMAPGPLQNAYNALVRPALVAQSKTSVSLLALICGSTPKLVGDKLSYQEGKTISDTHRELRDACSTWWRISKEYFHDDNGDIPSGKDIEWLMERVRIYLSYTELCRFLSQENATACKKNPDTPKKEWRVSVDANNQYKVFLEVRKPLVEDASEWTMSSEEAVPNFVPKGWWAWLIFGPYGRQKFDIEDGFPVNWYDPPVEEEEKQRISPAELQERGKGSAFDASQSTAGSPSAKKSANITAAVGQPSSEVWADIASALKKLLETRSCSAAKDSSQSPSIARWEALWRQYMEINRCIRSGEFPDDEIPFWEAQREQVKRAMEHFWTDSSAPPYPCPAANSTLNSRTTSALAPEMSSSSNKRLQMMDSFRG